jgi:aerobic carbon-monoxide dehydrogenase small subunit
MRVSLTLNGKTRSVTVAPRDTLATFLRDTCDLTATHLGCEHGACGACTVLVDGMAARSCTMLAVMMDGRTVETLEGLLGHPTLQLLQRHFHECHALQCGFCTPGMLVMAVDILRRHRAPDAATIRRELAGQICRCTGYVNIVEAIRRAGTEVAKPALETRNGKGEGPCI